MCTYIYTQIYKHTATHMHENIYIYTHTHTHTVKLATIIKGDPKAPFSLATTLMYRGWLYFDSYFIMLSVKQGRITCLFS